MVGSLEIETGNSEPMGRYFGTGRYHHRGERQKEYREEGPLGVETDEGRFGCRKGWIEVMTTKAQRPVLFIVVHGLKLHKYDGCLRSRWAKAVTVTWTYSTFCLRSQPLHPKSGI